MKSLLGKLGVILIGLMILGYAEAWGMNWKLFHQDDSGMYFYDMENIIRPSQDIVEGWTKLEYTERGVIEMVIKFGKHYKNLSYSLEFWEINCAEKEHRLSLFTAYSPEGKVLYTDEAGSRPPPWKTISRGSVEERLYKAVCK
jgi:Surface-adhesin protein E